MKTELTTNGLQPPDKRELDFDEFAEKAIAFVKRNIPVEQLYDLYNHDREVAKNFHEWYEKSGWMPASTLGGKYSLHEGYINTDPRAPGKVSFEQLWEIFCTETKQ